jgi:hypothetical protein
VLQEAQQMLEGGEGAKSTIKLDQIEISLVHDLERRDLQEAITLRAKIVSTKRQRAGKVAELLME